jgi:hypothetical protein
VIPSPGRWRASRALWVVGAGAIASLAASGACDAPRATSCPGERVGSFSFRAEPRVSDPAAAGAGCAFTPDGGLTFNATISYLGETEAVLCVDRPEATPLRGTRSGSHISVGSPQQPATIAACSCAVEVTESVEGDVAPDGEAVAFTGELRNVLATGAGTDPASCEAGSDGGLRCGVPCELRWQLTAVR